MRKPKLRPLGLLNAKIRPPTKAAMERYAERNVRIERTLARIEQCYGLENLQNLVDVFRQRIEASDRLSLGLFGPDLRLHREMVKVCDRLIAYGRDDIARDAIALSILHNALELEGTNTPARAELERRSENLRQGPARRRFVASMRRKMTRAAAETHWRTHPQNKLNIQVTAIAIQQELTRQLRDAGLHDSDKPIGLTTIRDHLNRP